MKTEIIIISILLVLSISRCNTTEPPPPPDEKPTLTLALEDASSIEAWIKITTTNLQLPATVNLKQSASGGNAVTQDIILSYADTVIYIDSLLPNTTYNFQASSIQSAEDGPVSSNQLQVTTMDTTSHNFTWQSWIFGEVGSSVLYDVAIIDPNNIWCVGEIYLNDSLGQPDPNAYNAVHWDGNEWTLQRIVFTGGCHAVIYPPIKSVWAFTNENIWYASGGSLVHFDGNDYFNDCRMNSFLTGSINKIWGTSSNDLYIVGNNGNIAHFNGNNWRKLFSGTDVDIQDIWGIVHNTYDPLILCAASNIIEPGEHKILNIKIPGSVDTIPWGTGRRVHSLWFNSKNQLFASGGGVFIQNYDEHWVEQTEVPLYFTERVRGKEKNDLFVVGHFGLIAHYNGVSWREYPEAAVALVYTSLDYKENLMVTVGYTQSQAVIQFMIKN